MSITLKVPSIACDACANSITQAIHNGDPSADVQVDVDSKMVVVETETSEGKIKELITSAGHTVE